MLGNPQKNLSVCLLIFTILTPTLSTLGVYNLEALEESNPELKNISYSIANYGFAPYLIF